MNIHKLCIAGVRDYYLPLVARDSEVRKKHRLPSQVLDGHHQDIVRVECPDPQGVLVDIVS